MCIFSYKINKLFQQDASYKINNFLQQCASFLLNGYGGGVLHFVCNTFIYFNHNNSKGLVFWNGGGYYQYNSNLALYKPPFTICDSLGECPLSFEIHSRGISSLITHLFVTI